PGAACAAGVPRPPRPRVARPGPPVRRGGGVRARALPRRRIPERGGGAARAGGRPLLVRLDTRLSRSAGTPPPPGAQGVRAGAAEAALGAAAVLAFAVRSLRWREVLVGDRVVLPIGDAYYRAPRPPS